jgi:hypothetical protein
MSDRMSREHDTVQHANSSHELGNVGVHRALFNSKGNRDFLLEQPATNMGSTSFSRVVNSRGPIAAPAYLAEAYRLTSSPRRETRFTPSTPSVARSRGRVGPERNSSPTIARYTT